MSPKPPAKIWTSIDRSECSRLCNLVNEELLKMGGSWEKIQGHLGQLRDKGLYLIDFPNWAAFCEAKFDKSVRQINRVIAKHTLALPNPKGGERAESVSTDGEQTSDEKDTPPLTVALGRGVPTEPQQEGVPADEKPLAGKPKPQPPKQYPRSHWFKQWEMAIGPLVRLVDKIADEVKEKHDPHQEAVQELLNDATKRMMAWMGVKK